MELAQLAIFKAVVDEGGVTRAARRLHRVQSNVTTRLRQLEDELGVALFLREGRRLRLTPAGHVFLDYAERLLALADEARNAVRDERPRGPLVLGAMESTAAVRLPRPLTRYHRRHPDVTLRLRTGNPRQLAAALRAGEVDAALITEPTGDDAFDGVAVFDEELVLVSAADHPPIGAGRALPSTIIVFEHGCPHRKRLEDWYAAAGSAPAEAIELSSYHAMLGCVVVGMGIALLPRSVLETFPERRRLGVHVLPEGYRQLRTRLVWRRGALSPNVAALRDTLEHERAAASRSGGRSR